MADQADELVLLTLLVAPGRHVGPDEEVAGRQLGGRALERGSGRRDALPVAGRAVGQDDAPLLDVRPAVCGAPHEPVEGHARVVADPARHARVGDVGGHEPADLAAAPTADVLRAW
ncbi:hypothetical protein, partial [Cellulosimicrobium funkei]